MKNHRDRSPWTEAEKVEMRHFVLTETTMAVIDGYLAGNADLADFDGYLDRYYNLPTEPQLTGRDRCDRCGSRAMVSVTFNGTTDLLFCGHHAREHAEALAPYTIPRFERFEA